MKHLSRFEWKSRNLVIIHHIWIYLIEVCWLEIFELFRKFSIFRIRLYRRDLVELLKYVKTKFKDSSIQPRTDLSKLEFSRFSRLWSSPFSAVSRNFWVFSSRTVRFRRDLAHYSRVEKKFVHTAENGPTENRHFWWFFQLCLQLESSFWSFLLLVDANSF